MAMEALILESPVVPVWFYSYSAVVFLISAFVGILIAAYSYKLYKKTKSGLGLLFFFSFVAISIAFITLLATSLYTYLYPEYFRSLQNLDAVNRAGYAIYYLTSSISYITLLIAYLPSKIRNKLFVFYVPLWYSSFDTFHILAIIILAYIVLKNIVNLAKKKNLDSALVMLAFMLILASHSMQLLIPFNFELFLLSHTLLVFGFVAFLIMLIRVSGDEKEGREGRSRTRRK
jgi:hypothetical protein